MKRLVLLFFLCRLFTLRATAQTVETWLTTLDKTALLQPQPVQHFVVPQPEAAPATITVSRDSQYQSVDGFGFALTGGSAQHIFRMTPAERRKLLLELFSRGEGQVGISYLRVSIGASDLNEKVFSYDDLPDGQTDPLLAKFNLGPDKVDVIPVLKEILVVNPTIKILGSPWSAPIWMKTNNNIQGGKLKEQYFPAYAAYFVKYIRAMKANGITMDAVTVQNEPFNNGNTPSMQMFAKEQARFIRDHLGPAFRKNGFKTKIILYDHNCDAPEYPISILTDAAARQYVDGSGFHLYAGPITALTKVHESFPEKHLYFTEMMAVNRNEFNVAGPVARTLIGAMRNWSRNVILWNLAADSANKPHTDNGGCSMCQGAVTIDGDRVQRNLAYYTIAHASTFIPPNSVRIKSTETDSLANVAFRTPSGKTVLIVANRSRDAQTFSVAYENRRFSGRLSRGDVVTFVW